VKFKFNTENGTYLVVSNIQKAFKALPNSSGPDRLWGLHSLLTNGFRG